MFSKRRAQWWPNFRTGAKLRLQLFFVIFSRFSSIFHYFSGFPADMLRQIGKFYHQGEEYETSRVWMTCWHHGGRILASCGDDKAVRVWSLFGENGESVFILIFKV